jgi:hypothetical protein
MAPSLTPEGVHYTLQDRYIVERDGLESRFSIEAALIDGVDRDGGKERAQRIEHDYLCAQCEGMEAFLREHPRRLVKGGEEH